jgi:hypothetical protein
MGHFVMTKDVAKLYGTGCVRCDLEIAEGDPIFFVEPASGVFQIICYECEARND